MVPGDLHESNHGNMRGILGAEAMTIPFDLVRKSVCYSQSKNLR
jgi:hypothetical protein